MPTISTTNAQRKTIDMFGGMDKLIEAANDKANDFEEIFLDLIKPNPYQIRVVGFEDVAELANDIYTNTMLQIPIGRRMPDGTTQQAFGHRRKLAHDLIVAHGQDGDEEFANWQQFTTMKMIVKPLTDMEMYLYMASENGQRENPNVMEVARSIKTGQEQFGLNQMDAAKPHGVTSSGNISVMLSLLTLPLSVQALIEGGAFGMGKNAGLRHGSQLVKLVKAKFDDDEILILAEQAIKQDMPVATLQIRVDHEIKVRNQQTTKVNRHCPHCGGVIEVSEWQLQNEGAIFQKCARCGIKDYRLSGWFTPERQAEKDKILAAVKQTSFMAEAAPTEVKRWCPKCETEQSFLSEFGHPRKCGQCGASVQWADWLEAKPEGKVPPMAEANFAPPMADAVDAPPTAEPEAEVMPPTVEADVPSPEISYENHLNTRYCPTCGDERTFKEKWVGDETRTTQCPNCLEHHKVSAYTVGQLERLYCPRCSNEQFINRTWLYLGGITECPNCHLEIEFQDYRLTPSDGYNNPGIYSKWKKFEDAPPTAEPEATPEPEGSMVMVQLEEVKKDGRKVKMFIRKSDNPAVNELAERLWGCLSDDDTVNIAALFDVLIEIGWKETLEAKFGEAIGNEVPPVLKARLIKKLLAAL